MRTILLAMLLLWFSASFAQSNKDMIIASWKCVGIDKAPVETGKKQKAKSTIVEQMDTSYINAIRTEVVGTVYGFRNNGSLITNTGGMYETRPYKVEGDTLTLTRFAPMHTEVHTSYTIIDLNYRTMTWQDKDGFVYRFERE